MMMALQNMKPTSLLTAACLPHTMVEQNYTALHDIVELLLRAALHRDKICLGQLELRATAQGSGSKKLRPVLTLSEGDPQRSSRPAGPSVLLPRSAGGCQPPRGAWRFAIPGCNAALPLAPRRCQRRRELHAGTRSLRRRRPRRRRPPCSMLPPRRSPAALAAGQTPAPEGEKKLGNSRRKDPAGLAGAACARGANRDAGVQRLPQGLDQSQMPTERTDRASMAGTYSVQLTKHLHCFFELPGQASALLLTKNFLFSAFG